LSAEDIEMIERQRKKRAFEVSLPPLEHSEAFEVRRKMMEEQELLEWEIREKQIRMYRIPFPHFIELQFEGSNKRD
jgi:hypothetical protein